MTCSIVVVDDEPSFLDVALSVLSQHPGVTVVGTATSGEQALELYSTLRPEVVIMDVQMPGMNGFEAARRLRRQGAGVRVLIVSAHDEPQYEAIARAAGAEGFMTKKALLSNGIARFLS
jgi:DNA-binding NarL/FixJ family response regulator